MPGLEKKTVRRWFKCCRENETRDGGISSLIPPSPYFSPYIRRKSLPVDAISRTDSELGAGANPLQHGIVPTAAVLAVLTQFVFVPDNEVSALDQANKEFILIGIGIG